MAKVTTKKAEVTYVLDLTEAEAVYVRSALFRMWPTSDGVPFKASASVPSGN